MATRQTFSVSFYCRESKKDKKGLAPVEVSMSINGVRKFFKLQRKERPQDFAKAMKSNRDNEIKVYCENQRIWINKIVEDMQFAEIELTADNLKECLRKGGVSNYYTMGQLWSDTIYNKMADVKVGQIETDTFRRYNLAKEAFYKANGFSDDTPAKNAELQHIINFQHYLRNDLNLSQCTAYNYHARAKSAFVLAFNRGKIKTNPYGCYKLDKGEKKETKYLSKSEIQAIRGKDLIGRLDKIRDLFLFQCYSGLSYSDMALLQPTDFQKNDKGQIFIQKKRKKTNKPFKSIVLRDGVGILEKYNYTLPVISNVKYNAYLKEIQTLCGIDKTLHTHLGRTTYICYLYNEGVPIDIIAEIVGHASCHTTLKYYAKMENETMFETFSELGIAEGIETPKSIRPHDPNYKAKKKANVAKSSMIIDQLKTTGLEI